MGVKDDEAIEQSIISKSILNAQKKIAAKIKLEHFASSQQQWLERNV